MNGTNDALARDVFARRPRWDAGAGFRGTGFGASGFQHTLGGSIGCAGIGLHSGITVGLTLHPGEPNSGIVFLRADLGQAIAARHDHVVDTRHCTVLGVGDARIGTVEHLMAALCGRGIDNAVVEVDGPEVPILDGSAEPFVFLIDCAGVVAQPAPRRAIEVRRMVRVERGAAWAELRPGGGGLELQVSIDFAAGAIGRQSHAMSLSEQGFRDELAPARTFALASEVATLHAAGLGRGGSLDNAVVVDGEAILNPAGLRMECEFVRHKAMDAVGDLALAGAPLHGRYVAHRAGHALNNGLLRALFADRDNWRMEQGALLAAA